MLLKTSRIEQIEEVPSFSVCGIIYMKIEIARQNEVVGCSDNLFKKLREVGKKCGLESLFVFCCSWSINCQQTKLFILGVMAKSRVFATSSSFFFFFFCDYAVDSNFQLLSRGVIMYCIINDFLDSLNFPVLDLKRLC